MEGVEHGEKAARVKAREVGVAHTLQPVDLAAQLRRGVEQPQRLPRTEAGAADQDEVGHVPLAVAAHQRQPPVQDEGLVLPALDGRDAQHVRPRPARVARRVGGQRQRRVEAERDDGHRDAGQRPPPQRLELARGLAGVGDDEVGVQAQRHGVAAEGAHQLAVAMLGHGKRDRVVEEEDEARAVPLPRLAEERQVPLQPPRRAERGERIAGAEVEGRGFGQGALGGAARGDPARLLAGAAGAGGGDQRQQRAGVHAAEDAAALLHRHGLEQRRRGESGLEQRHLHPRHAHRRALAPQEGEEVGNVADQARGAG